VQVEEGTPDWDSLSLLSCTVKKCNLQSVKDIKGWVAREPEATRARVQVASAPCAHGSVRKAYHGLRHFSDASPEAVVLKEFITPAADPSLDQHRYMVDLDTQTTAASLARVFNKELAKTTDDPGMDLRFLVAKLVTLVGIKPRFMAMEKQFRGEMVKLTNNYNLVRTVKSLGADMQPFVDLATAFSHFTWEHTGHYCMVCDLQGISTTDDKGRKALLLTDPAIHCPGNLRFGKTNLQHHGVEAFFEVHKCNRFCKALGLRLG
jgi:hypothetical protein